MDINHISIIGLCLAIFGIIYLIQRNRKKQKGVINNSNTPVNSTTETTTQNLPVNKEKTHIQKKQPPQKISYEDTLYVRSNDSKINWNELYLIRIWKEKRKDKKTIDSCWVISERYEFFKNLPNRKKIGGQWVFKIGFTKVA